MFKVSARTQYGIRAMVYLARKLSGEASIAEIAAAESISPKYLEGIMGQLKSRGLVESERGKNGGYRLSSEPECVSMLAIVEALDGTVKPVTCIDASCIQDGSCMPRRFWVGLKEVIDGYLGTRTLKDVTKG